MRKRRVFQYLNFEILRLCIVSAFTGIERLGFSQLVPHTMAKLHTENRYDRLTHDVETIIGKKGMSIREYVAKHLKPGILDEMPRGT